MAEPTIYLALTDDWELRGDGSGDIDKLQFAPMRELLSIYSDNNIRSTVMAEVMQQLTFQRERPAHPELGAAADQWDEHIREAHRQGHDVQLHVHPQWSDAEYEGGRWTLRGGWELSKYGRGEASKMIAAGRAYLEQLLRPEDPDYNCRAFRAGASAIAPGEFLLNELVENGIELDISIIAGYQVRTRNLAIDFTSCDEGRLPYYPRMDDARRVSDKREEIVCMPQFQFIGSRMGAGKQIASKAAAKLGGRTEIPGGGYAAREWSTVGGSKIGRIVDKALMPVIRGKWLVADVGQLGGTFLPEVLPNLRRLARQSGLQRYPAVLSNHSKDIKEFEAIRRFAASISAARDVKTVTLTELTALLAAGEIPIRTAS